MRAVYPAASFAFTSAPAASSAFAISTAVFTEKKYPRLPQASMRAVSPWSFLAFTSAPLASSAVTWSDSPLALANKRALLSAILYYREIIVGAYAYGRDRGGYGRDGYGRAALLQLLSHLTLLLSHYYQLLSHVREPSFHLCLSYL